MPVSIYQLGYKKLSRIIFDWQDADRASLLSLFIVIEVSLHWLWCGFIWLRRDTFGTYVDVSLLYPMWLCVTLMWLLFFWLVGHLAHIKNNNQLLHYWQIVLIVIYSLYIAGVILVTGHSSLVSGISLVGGTMLGMMLVRRTYIWRAFLWQVFLIVLVTMVPYLNIQLPNLRQLNVTSIPLDTYSYITYSETTTLENAIDAALMDKGSLTWEGLFQMRRSSSFFWRSTHLYLALPKAIFMVYVFRVLLLILDDSKKKILKYANQDGLTKLNNRRFGLLQMQQSIMAMSHSQDYSVILLDLDWFKNINDNHGHEVGDHVLREVARILKKTFDSEDVVSRYGGEEFLIVLPNTEHDMAMAIAEQLRQAVAQQVIKVSDTLSLQVTASLGVYTLLYDELVKIKQECTPTVAYLDTNKASVRSELSGSTLCKRKLKKLQGVALRTERRAIEYSRRQQNAQLSSDVCSRLISIADKALYKAKEQGRNQVVSANSLLANGIVFVPR